jgi:hypothetical protein
MLRKFTIQRTNNDNFLFCSLLIGVFFLCLWFSNHVIAVGTVKFYSHQSKVLLKPFLNALTQELPIKQLVILELEVQMIIDRVGW